MWTEIWNVILHADLTNYLGEAAKSNLGNWLIILTVMWKTMGKKVATHFSAMESAVSKLTAEVGFLRRDLTSGLAQTANRLDAVERGMVALDSRVTKLEPKGENHGNY